jgi:hypothetical protein
VQQAAIGDGLSGIGLMDQDVPGDHEIERSGELEYNPTDSFQIELGAAGVYHAINSVEGLDDFHGANFGGLSSTFRYLLIAEPRWRSKMCVLAACLEVEQNREAAPAASNDAPCHGLTSVKQNGLG